MNELAKLIPFCIEDMDRCRIVDNNENPWFVAKDIAEILGISSYRVTIADFPENEKSYVVCAVYSIYGTSVKPRARKTQKVLVINEDGLFRLILKSRKPEAWRIKNRFIEILSDIRKKGIVRAALPKTWSYGKEENLTWNEYVKKRETAYFRRYPDATLDDFLLTLPNR